MVLTALAALCLSCCFTAANAQATRTWVSGVGDDANPCSRTAPCKTFAGAISKTAAGGEINCLDSGGFGAVTITKSIAIYCDGVVGGVVVAGTNGIVVNVTTTDIVYLRGLDINGTGTGLSGISFVGGGVLHVERCIIRRFNAGTASGIRFAPTSSAELYVYDTTISENGIVAGTVGGGIIIAPAVGGSALATIMNVRSNNNIVGLKTDASNGGTVIASIQLSSFSGNVFAGLHALSLGATSSIMVDMSNINSNANNGLNANGTNSVIRISRSNVIGNSGSFVVSNSGVVSSYNNNHIDGNAPNTAPPTIPER